MKLAAMPAIAFCVMLAISLDAHAQTGASDDVTTSPPVAQVSAKVRRAQNHMLQKSVRHALTATKGLNSSRVGILAKDGVVSLVGDAPDQRQIDRAVATAQSVPGVKQVNNVLKVFEPGR